jgi:FKBP-type peptidyl-prolyl cis-trans isomerase
MNKGEKAQVVCPSSVAYGDAGNPPAGIPPGATLSFEVELLDFHKP